MHRNIHLSLHEFQDYIRIDLDYNYDTVAFSVSKELLSSNFIKIFDLESSYKSRIIDNKNEVFIVSSSWIYSIQLKCSDELSIDIQVNDKENLIESKIIFKSDFILPKAKSQNINYIYYNRKIRKSARF